MTLENTAHTASLSRKKATAGIVFLVVVLLVWQVSSMFGKAASSPPKANATGAGSVAVAQTTQAAVSAANQMKPKPVDVKDAVPMTEQEKALMVLQQETQVKYLTKLNELQLLRVEKDIANTNKDISDANLGKVTSEKKTVDLLLGGSTTSQVATTPTTVTATDTGAAVQTPVNPLGGGEVNYTVVSVSEVQYRWAAVLSYNNTLYNVHVGDVLPLDGSTVAAIAKDSVTLQKKDVKKKIPLVSII